MSNLYSVSNSKTYGKKSPAIAGQQIKPRENEVNFGKCTTTSDKIFIVGGVGGTVLEPLLNASGKVASFGVGTGNFEPLPTLTCIPS